jgi:hypothetical protein
MILYVAKQNKTTSRVAQVVQREALSSDPSTTTKQNKTKKPRL